LELLGSQLEELHTAALGAGSEGGRACRMLEAGLSGLRRLVSGQRALLDKLVLRESARFQQQQQQQQMMQQQRRRRRDDDEVIEYIQPDGAAAASASADGGSSHYDNYGGGDGGNSDNWSRWMLAPSSSLLPRTDSLDHLREDDDDYRGFGEAGAAANFNSYGVQGLETRHYNSVDDMRAWLAAGASGGGGGFQGFADDVTLDEEVSRCLRQQQHQQQQHHLMMETDSASGCGSGERMRCPVCGLSMPPNGDLSAFNLHVNSHFADD
uniref:Zn-C2H2_12 domain-containing protein n=1 Tax=Macrostomum lignano TaxID=282301 RepID=A0A1I8HWV8_9PLAT